ncbi:MAG TPA: SRPBCC family protein [Flavobacterium sp.]|jgi:uncharacterized protein YndB with AHSA1/START domain
MSQQKIIIQATILADTTKVWDCWTLPQHIINWNFASADWHCPSAENDLTTGGHFKYVMASRDGGTSFDFEGVYNEIIEYKKIAYTMPDGREVTVQFEDNGKTTTVISAFDPENINPEEMQQAGWQSILDNFKKYVESNM